MMPPRRNMHEFSGALAEFNERVVGLMRRIDRGAIDLPVAQALEELGTAAEELSVAEEEMNVQHAELILARASLEASERRYRELFDLASDAYVLTDTRGKIQEGNRRAAQLLGFPQLLLVGKPLPAFIALPDRRGFRHLLNRLLKGDRVEGWEASVTPTKRTPISVELTADPQFTSDGAVAGWRWTVRDVSERKRLEREAIEAADRERTRLGQELHDDVSQRLTGALFGLHTLGMDLKARRSAFRPRVDEVMRHLSGAMKTLRAMSHRLAVAAVPPERLAEALADLAEATRDATGIACTFLATGRPLTTPPDAATHLLRIAQEAVVNAIRHAAPRSITVRLHIDDDGGLLAILDDGSGFDESTATLKGSLGLRSMRLRADYIGGTLAVKPGPGGGTSVECRFPMAAERDQPMDAA